MMWTLHFCMNFFFLRGEKKSLHVPGGWMCQRRTERNRIVDCAHNMFQNFEFRAFIPPHACFAISKLGCVEYLVTTASISCCCTDVDLKYCCHHQYCSLSSIFYLLNCTRWSFSAASSVLEIKSYSCVWSSCGTFPENLSKWPGETRLDG